MRQFDPTTQWQLESAINQVMAEGGRGLAKHLGVRLLANEAVPVR